eukprot:1114591-Amphidinium_carterae.1
MHMIRKCGICALVASSFLTSSSHSGSCSENARASLNRFSEVAAELWSMQVPRQACHRVDPVAPDLLAMGLGHVLLHASPHNRVAFMFHALGRLQERFESTASKHECLAVASQRTN